MITNLPTVHELEQQLPSDALLQADATRHTRIGWWIVLMGFGGLLLWALLAPLDQGVPMSGTITVAGNKKSVQHQSGGTVQTIFVKEGDAVKAGQPLVQMNAVQVNRPGFPR